MTEFFALCAHARDRKKFVEPARLFGPRVAVGVGAAGEPEHRGGVPLRAERSEILAGRRRSGRAGTIVLCAFSADALNLSGKAVF